jgi:hypothetical protein
MPRQHINREWPLSSPGSPILRTSSLDRCLEEFPRSDASKAATSRAPPNFDCALTIVWPGRSDCDHYRTTFHSG